MRRIVSFFLALMLLCALAFPASAASDEFLAFLRECIRREMSYTASRMTSVETITVNDDCSVFTVTGTKSTELENKLYSLAETYAEFSGTEDYPKIEYVESSAPASASVPMPTPAAAAAQTSSGTEQKGNLNDRVSSAIDSSVKNIFQDDIVWITNLDEKYHSKPDCGGADASKSYQIMRSVAVPDKPNSRNQKYVTARMI